MFAVEKEESQKTKSLDLTKEAKLKRSLSWIVEQNMDSFQTEIILILSLYITDKVISTDLLLCMHQKEVTVKVPLAEAPAVQRAQHTGW